VFRDDFCERPDERIAVISNAARACGREPLARWTACDDVRGWNAKALSDLRVFDVRADVLGIGFNCGPIVINRQTDLKPGFLQS
jgi:hypothetical protein